ncbi:helix-turn-helix domain-containing protein [Pseudochryseolinea flava]|nr:AraC family transcriptional regulator [Pseudochryseolinea flava]
MKNEIPVLASDSVFTSVDLKKSSKTNSVQQFTFQYKCLWRDKIPVHRTDQYMVVMVFEGEGIQTIGLREYSIAENMICFIAPNMVSSWHATSDSKRGFSLTFSEDFFNIGRTDKSFLSSLPFFQLDGNPVFHLTPESFAYFESLFRLLEAESLNREAASDDVIRGFLFSLMNKALSLEANSHRVVNVTNPNLRLLKQFTGLFMQDFKPLEKGESIRLQKVSAYADSLGVSQNHLNDIVKKLTGKSAGQLIQQQLVSQATVCLKHSSKTVSEIAYQFGFEDPSYFARFYKTQTGQAPSALR